MSFPALALRPGGALTVEGTGVPANGPNVITTNFNLSPQELTNDPFITDWLDLDVYALGPGVSGASLVAVASDLSTITINFTQTASDSAKVTATLKWSGER